jgi:hypothetical protein
VRAAVVLALAAALAGCGGTTSYGAGAGGGGATGSSTPAACRTPVAIPSGSAHVVRVTGADSDGVLCVPRGELLEVDLAAPRAMPWSITAQGSALRETSRSGRSPVFEAVAPGTGYIRATRRACGAPDASAAACGAIQAFTVTVVVR